MLTPIHELMQYANTHRCAIGSFNTPDIATLRAVIASAEQLDCPVIIMHAQIHEPFAPVSLIGPAMLAAARAAKVPVCVHLDHGVDADYIQKALEVGFNSVMFDGSTLPYEDNVRVTKQVVSLARQKGASVEGEIGALGRRELGIGETVSEAHEIYTDPDLAREYVERTGVHLLACSFGTAHGLYLKAPQLDFEVLRRVGAKVNLPLVMHGGSGVSKADYRTAIACGIRKINYFTYMSKAGGEAVRDLFLQRQGKPVYYYETSDAAFLPMVENAREALAIFLGREE